MSENTNTAPQATSKDAFFFLTILSNMKNKPDVDWEVVAEKAGYSNANTAKVRFGQIKKKLGFTDDGAPAAAGAVSPKAITKPKPRAKKEKTASTGSNVPPSKVFKAPLGSSIKKKQPFREPSSVKPRFLNQNPTPVVEDNGDEEEFDYNAVDPLDD